jgi:hypothetical protein
MRSQHWRLWAGVAGSWWALKLGMVTRTLPPPGEPGKCPFNRTTRVVPVVQSSSQDQGRGVRNDRKYDDLPKRRNTAGDGS